MATSTDYVATDLKTQQSALNNRKKSSKSENRPPKERICNMVLRDEDEETDDEDLTINPNSPVSLVVGKLKFSKLRRIFI